MTGDMARFLFVLVCFLLSFTYKKYASSKKDAYSLRLALLFTVLGDFCLILKGYRTPGLICFCAVQLIYAYRFTGKKITAVLIPALIIMFIAGSKLVTEEILLGTMYLACLLTAVCCSFLSSLPRPNKGLASLAMVLFLLCDINVGMYNLEIFTDYRNITFVLIWIFYCPSQILLAFSAKKF